MMKVIVYDAAGGRLHVRGARTPSFLALFDGDDDAAVQHILDNLMPSDALNIRVLDSPTFPSNRTFRNAWEAPGANVTTNMPKARLIKMDQIRAERDVRLAATDIDVFKLDGQAIPAPLKAKRQALRDIPATVQADLNSAATPEALEAFEPTWP